ncbi:MAG: DNA replication/repair protein RecF [Acetobacteraceae bacterium]|nr:DNA replication/repair protein RecF [Acetobacteraceae bacterium]
MTSLRLIRLSLSDFRSYAALTWRPGARIAVLHGANGTGKTNLLEAISLLVPGRGLRGARIGELARQGSAAWAVAARFDTADGPMEVGTGTPPDGQGERRAFRLDGAPPRNLAAVGARLAAVWLTPQMDRLFQEAAGGRRRFLDRLVYALEPGHAREIAAHETAMAGRNRLLAEGRRDAAWLAGLEDAMARHAVAATAARLELVSRLNATPPAGAFPAARLALDCAIAARLVAAPALAVEDWLRDGLAASRAADAARGSATLGAHRSDMALADAATGLPAALASTGEQKALLIGVILAHARLLAAARGAAPLLLLDEPAVHLDPERRAALFDALLHLPGQIVLTGTDPGIFAPLRGHATAWRTARGASGTELAPDPEFPPPGPV